ncbi:hypothetical protein EDF35_1928 [Rathayibacter sp. PhB151]|uniref:phage portal protein family protein n=1 Tax=Rathayibacter sp. PhB151 TaxID=2485189 RepID=UPI0010EEB702|nr:hypothetical protein [Rathayibacter sp. PhB151]TDX78714.1 hypothetical protein EDF35_1928 [Rathayibacter sp. PhB151]
MADELGYQNGALPSWGNLYADAFESNPDLVHPKSIEVYDRMRSEDAQVQSVLRAVTFPILSAEYLIDPAGARDEVVDLIAADFGLQVKGRPPTTPLRTKGRFSWTEHMRLALLELVYGHSVFEQVYDVTSGQTRLAKLAWRPPRTIAKMSVAADGGLESVTQYGKAGSASIPIPIDFLVVYCNDREGGNWLGRSMLRSAYKYWKLKDGGLRVQAQTLERNGLGVPTYTAPPDPPDLEGAELVAWRQRQQDMGLAIAKAYRSGEQAGVSLPHGAKLELQGVTGTLPDSDKPIRYYDEQIARAVLAHVLNLGGDNSTGSYALGDTFARIFADSLNAVADHVLTITNQHVVEDLVDKNFGPTEPAPRIVCKPIGAQAPVTAEAVKTLLESGGITSDADLEAFLRQTYGLPIKAEGGGATKSDADTARAAAEVIQKSYLGVGKVINADEARDLARRAGAILIGEAPAQPEQTAIGTQVTDFFHPRTTEEQP